MKTNTRSILGGNNKWVTGYLTDVDMASNTIKFFALVGMGVVTKNNFALRIK